MLLGTLVRADSEVPCLIGIERNRVVVVAQDDLARFSWPAQTVALDARQTALEIDAELRFIPDMPDRFRWVMTAALQEAASRRAPWWRRSRRPSIRGLATKLAMHAAPDSAAA